MKRILIGIMASTLLLSQVAWAASSLDTDKCDPKKIETSAKIEKLCNNVDDIICKDVKKEERRSCDGKNDTIIRKNMTASEVFAFAQGCFKSSVTSFKNFFTEFVPELLGAMWKLLRGASELTVNSFSSSKEEAGWWGKIKGIYESSVSIGADIYEVAKQDPGAFLANIWDKMVDAVGPVVASYDCLNPQMKVEKICGFVAGWVVPPAMFAKLLVKGAKFAKESLSLGKVSVNAAEKLRLQKLLELADKKPKITMKQYQEIFDKYKSLGYTDEEFDYLQKSGLLEKIKLTDLKVVTSSVGNKQRRELLDEYFKSKKAIATTAATTAQVNAGKKVQPKVLTPQELKAVQNEMRGDYITLEARDSSGKLISVPAKISERHSDGLTDIGYKISYVDTKTGMIKEATVTTQSLSKLKPKAGNNEIGLQFEATAAKDPKYRDTSLDEFNRLKKQQDEEALRDLDFTKKENLPKKDTPEHIQTDGLTVRDSTLAEFEAAQNAKPISSNGGLDFKLDDESRQKARLASEAMKKRIALENEKERARQIRESLKPKPKGGLGMSGEVLVTDKFKSNFLVVNSKNSMGITTSMPTEIVKKININGSEKFLVRIFDKTNGSYSEKTLSFGELRGLNPKESTSAFGEIKNLKTQIGLKEDFLN